jgi:hypothetical protein
MAWALRASSGFQSPVFIIRREGKIRVKSSRSSIGNIFHNGKSPMHVAQVLATRLLTEYLVTCRSENSTSAKGNPKCVRCKYFKSELFFYLQVEGYLPLSWQVTLHEGYNSPLRPPFCTNSTTFFSSAVKASL